MAKFQSLSVENVLELTFYVNNQLAFAHQLSERSREKRHHQGTEKHAKACLVFKVQNSCPLVSMRFGRRGFRIRCPYFACYGMFWPFRKLRACFAIFRFLKHILPLFLFVFACFGLFRPSFLDFIFYFYTLPNLT